ncbi:MAG: RdgB/HAM1 family non-canonical purine NTP pyrophosphatase [Pseudomonadota bacterium]
MDKLLLATHNQGKVDEFRHMLNGAGIDVKSNADFDLPEPEETEDNFIGNALIKARAAMKATGLPALADDSGLSIDALDGAPGVYTADWAETRDGRDFVMAMEKVNDKLDGIKGDETAYFTSVLALVFPDGTEEIFEGSVNGTLCWPMRGAQGHGYDPIFVPDGHDQSFAEMDPVFKNIISHRSKSVQKFLSYLKQHA